MVYNSVAKSFSCTLRNCIPLSALWQAKQTHTQILIHGLLHHLSIQTDLLLVYSRCNFLQSARKVFDQMLHKNMHSWNIMIFSYTQSSLFHDSLSLFGLFLRTGSKPDHYTFPPLFKACAEIKDFSLGLNLQKWVIKLGFEDYLVVSSSLLDFYSKHECLSDAYKVFDKMSSRDTVAWNSMISAFARAEHHAEALNCFRNMLDERMKMDCMTISSILNVCGKCGDMIEGKQIHGQVMKNAIFFRDVAIGNSLIDMYSKCGCLFYAENIFSNMQKTNLITWTTLISCYGVHGEGEKSLIQFNKMRDSGLEPNNITLTALLSSCSHSGLLDHGRTIFNSIRAVYGIEPSVEHFACMVDLLGRFGCLNEALILIQNMKSVPTSSVWGALLSGCLMHKNIAIAEIATKYLFELEPKNPSNYVALCSIYEHFGNRDGVSRIRLMMKEMGLVKKPGCSWIINNKGEVHKFYQGDISHPLSGMICGTLDVIFKNLVSKSDNFDIEICI